MSFREYRRTLLLGCSDCYQSFEKQLSEDLRRYHGTVRHSGKQPVAVSAAVSDQGRLDSLQKRLATAVQDEDFELAAQLRDQIRQIKDER